MGRVGEGRALGGPLDPAWDRGSLVCGCSGKSVLLAAAWTELVALAVHIVYTLQLMVKGGEWGWGCWAVGWAVSAGTAALLLRARGRAEADDVFPFVVWLPVKLASHLLLLGLGWWQHSDLWRPSHAHLRLLLETLAFCLYASLSFASLHGVWAAYDLLLAPQHSGAPFVASTSFAQLPLPPRPPPRNSKPPPLPPRRHRPRVEFTVNIPPRRPEPVKPRPERARPSTMGLAAQLSAQLPRRVTSTMSSTLRKLRAAPSLARVFVRSATTQTYAVPPTSDTA